MKKYNLSNIMKRAWELVKKAHMTISAGLRKAWEEAKKVNEILSGKVKFVNHMEVVVDGWTRELVRWTKGGYDRVYINGGSRRGEGYVDIKNGFVHLRGKAPYAKKMAEMILAMEF